MNAMAKSPGAFRATLLIGWIALGAAGMVYARARSVPGAVAWPALTAFLVEYPFYLVTAFPAWRERLAGARLPVFLLASAILPYLTACCGAVPFQWLSLVRLAALALALSLWYLVLPQAALADLAFLALVAAATVSKYLERIYPPPAKGVDVVILGHLAVIQIAVMALLVQRRVPEAGYGFLPAARDWRIGAVHYLYFVVAGLPLAWLLGATHFVTPAPWWKIPGIFLGTLWVVALSEEFFFRGALQSWMEQWTGNCGAALVFASALFGLVHLWFREFPNWRWALLVSVLGWFCGRARNQAGNIRAGMVTHALAVTTWRAFLA